MGKEQRILQAFSSGDDAPSDYDSTDLQGEKSVSVDSKEEDAIIRDALKRELLLLSSVTDRGEYATKDEQNILIDLVSQLEALNPTEEPAANSEGEWDLCLSSTHLFLSSPFFQSIRVALGDDNKAIAQNFFDIHDRATTASRIGRVRQTITSDLLLSEVDLQVGVLPGMPFRVQGTVVTKANIEVVSRDTFEARVQTTQVKGSNVPILNQILDDFSPNLELPVDQVYQTVQGKIPVVPFKTYYVDEAMRIVRDVDDNFFVFTRA
jgi:hypothetical protein